MLVDLLMNRSAATFARRAAMAGAGRHVEALSARADGAAGEGELMGYTRRRWTSLRVAAPASESSSSTVVARLCAVTGRVRASMTVVVVLFFVVRRFIGATIVPRGANQ